MAKGKAIVTDGKRIIVWRAIEGGADRGELGDKYGVSESSISYWYQQVNKDPALLDAAKSGRKISANANSIASKKNGKPKAKKKTRGKRQEWSTTDPPKERDDVKALVDEVKFLRWWNEGERFGFVDRLLKQIQE